MADNTSTSHTLESPWQRSQKENVFIWYMLPSPPVAQLRASPHFLTSILTLLWPLPAPHCDMKQADFPLLLITHTQRLAELWVHFFSIIWVTHSGLLSLRNSIEFSTYQVVEGNSCTVTWVSLAEKLLKTTTEHFDFTKTSSKKPDHNRSDKDKASMKPGLLLCFNQNVKIIGSSNTGWNDNE